VRPSVTLLIPTFNEIEGMRVIMPQVKAAWCDQILVVDGHSTDGTAEYARDAGYEVFLQSRPGIRHAYREAFERVRGDVVVTFSPDGNSPPELIPALVDKLLTGYDMVIASRYLPGVTADDDTVLTAFGNWTFTRLINLCHGGHYTDAMVMYRAYWKRVYYDLDLDKEDAYAPEKLFGTIVGIEPLLSVRAAKKQLRITEIPGDEPARIGGESKLLAFRWGASYLCQVFRELYYWR
jgi:glycosyltransferase involved in cell wall biosynthesis